MGIKMAKYQIVRIGDKYAVRRKWFSFGTYIDLTAPNLSWSRGAFYFRDCLTTNISVARAVARSLSMCPVVVEEFGHDH